MHGNDDVDRTGIFLVVFDRDKGAFCHRLVLAAEVNSVPQVVDGTGHALHRDRRAYAVVGLELDACGLREHSVLEEDGCEGGYHDAG